MGYALLLYEKLCEGITARVVRHEIGGRCRWMMNGKLLVLLPTEPDMTWRTLQRRMDVIGSGAQLVQYVLVESVPRHLRFSGKRPLRQKFFREHDACAIFTEYAGRRIRRSFGFPKGMDSDAWQKVMVKLGTDTPVRMVTDYIIEHGKRLFNRLVRKHSSETATSCNSPATRYAGRSIRRNAKQSIRRNAKRQTKWQRVDCGCGAYCCPYCNNYHKECSISYRSTSFIE